MEIMVAKIWEAIIESYVLNEEFAFSKKMKIFNWIQIEIYYYGS